MEQINKFVGIIFVVCGIAILIEQFGLFSFTFFGFDAAVVGAVLLVIFSAMQTAKNFLAGERMKGSVSVIWVVLGLVYFVKDFLGIPGFIGNNLGILYGILLIVLNFGKAM